MSARRRIVAGVLLGAVVLGGCGSSSPPRPTTLHGLQGLVLRPAKPAPALVLRNYTGTRVNLAQFHGHAVFVTFVYTHCPNVCPLIVANLAAARRALGARAQSMRIVAVTVDPKRDTRAAIAGFLNARSATGQMDYLIGSLPRLRPVWKAWHVAVISGHHQLTTGHSDIVYGITASGRIAVVYPSSFTPAQIVHDVPLLARS